MTNPIERLLGRAPMRRIRLVLLMLSIVALTMCAKRNEAKPNNEAQSNVDMLTNKLVSREISRVELLEIPARILTRTRIDPNMLETQYDYKLTMRNIGDSSYESDLTAALKSIRVEPSADMPDLRWGTIFYGTDDARVASIYFDGRGSAGAVNKIPVAFRGDFFKWLERKFGDCFK